MEKLFDLCLRVEFHGVWCRHTPEICLTFPFFRRIVRRMKTHSTKCHRHFNFHVNYSIGAVYTKVTNDELSYRNMKLKLFIHTKLHMLRLIRYTIRCPMTFCTKYDNLSQRQLAFTQWRTGHMGIRVIPEIHTFVVP